MRTVNRYRSELDGLVQLANRDLAVLAGDVRDGRVAADLLSEVLPALSAAYGSAAGVLAAEFYEDFRLEQGVSGRFSVLVADVPPRSRTDVLARWAVAPLFTDQPDPALVLSRAGGGLQRIIADVGRETVMSTSIEDPQAVGWQRVATPGGCGFCHMLAGRGAVYSKDTVQFGAHDNCQCAAVPAFGGKPRPVSPYTPGPRQASPEDRARTRKWMRENGYL